MNESVDNAPVKAEPAGFIARSNLLHVIWQRKWLVLLGIAVGLAIGAIAAVRSQPVYRSSAQVLVIKKRVDVVPITGGDPSQTYLEDYVSTHLVILKSPLVLEKAVKKGNLEGLKTFAGQGDPASVIRGGLSVSRDTTGLNRTIIDLTFQGLFQDETGTILNAVIESYTDFLEGAYRTVSKDTEVLIVKARDLLQKDLVEKEKQYRAFRQGTLLWKGKDGLNLHQTRLFDIESKKSSLLMQKADLEARLRAVEEAKKAGKEDMIFLPPRTEEGAGAAKGISSPKGATRGPDDQLVSLILEEQELLEDFGEDHPRVRSVRARINRTRKLLDLGQGTEDQQLPVGPGKAEDRVAKYLRSIQQELAGIEISMQALGGLAETEGKEAREVNKDEIEDERFRLEIGRTRQLYEETIKRLQEINLVRDFGGYDAVVISPAGPGWRVATSLVRIMIMAVALGFCGGVGLAYLADISDRSFRTPDEVRRSLRLPIMGHIPFYSRTDRSQKNNGEEKDATGIGSALCVHHRPNSGEAEAYRSLRTALYFAIRGSTHKIIQITSPNMGDGKTTLVANLAIAIAQSGKRVLIVDADFRRPRLHRLFKQAATSQGLAGILVGGVLTRDTIKPSGVPGLDILPCGTRPPNPAELLTLPDFGRVLDELKGDYDIILVDSPPLLAVTDPCIVAGHVDGVILAVRVTKNGRPTAERAKDLLVNIGVNLIGVIVNGVGREGVGYGYGAVSGYSYYYYDEYRYEYRNDEDEDNKRTEDRSLPAKG